MRCWPEFGILTLGQWLATAVPGFMQWILVGHGCGR